MERPKRKPNRLRNYDYAQSGAYFITICTIGRQKLLGEIVGGDAHVAPHMELSPLGKTAERYLKGIAGIDKYVIMPDHIHMILVVPPEQRRPTRASAPTEETLLSAKERGRQAVPQLVSSFKVLVTKEIGKPVFQRSFYDHIIRDEPDYREICEYIDTNTGRWEPDGFYRP